MARTYEASDYAGLNSVNLSAYYGYEETTHDGEWCFVARVKNKEILRIPQSALGARDNYNCSACLLAGLGILFDKFKLNEGTN